MDTTQACMLVSGIKHRNPDAVAALLDAFGSLIKSVVYRRLPELPQLREACVNDILMAIRTHIEAFVPKKSSLDNWIAGVRASTHLPTGAAITASPLLQSGFKPPLQAHHQQHRINVSDAVKN
ncbi:MAG: hypothetical protein QM689_11945 [Oscillospiraceae bacterium]